MAMNTKSSFRLEIELKPPVCNDVDQAACEELKAQTCEFKLSWVKENTCFADLFYPASLKNAYKQWQRAYRNYYNHQSRGKAVASGSGLPVNLRDKLMETENKLLFEFHRWLRNPKLDEIRSHILAATQPENEVEQHYVDVFLTCKSVELKQLPWERWDICQESPVRGDKTIRIAHTPINHSTPLSLRRHGSVRILVICGYDINQTFTPDENVCQLLKRMRKFKLLKSEPEEEPQQFKTRIINELSDPQGWDMLLFMGHSKENSVTSGEFEIAPNTSIYINKIRPQLMEATKRGLRFALFNSCTGIDIAESLIDMGLHQVIVMREKIDNQVAQEFLVAFLESMAEGKDVHVSLQTACQILKNRETDYPSAYLIPSLFRHPSADAELFVIERSWWKRVWQDWHPSTKEASALATLLFLSFLVFTQDLLLDTRLLAQACYRDKTNQIPANRLPPVRLIAIDQMSINQADAEINGFEIMPMDREYLAKLVTRLSNWNAKVIGIDYYLRTQEPKEEKLADSIQQAVQEQNSWFVFSVHQQHQWQVTKRIASPKWSLQGDTSFIPWYVEQPDDEICHTSCPFAYLLALSHRLNQHSNLVTVPQPNLNSPSNFQQQINQTLKNNREHEQGQAKMIPSVNLTNIPRPFHSIIDFSIPPDQVYQWIPAQTFLDLPFSDEELNRSITQQIVMIASGGYLDAEDNFSTPLAIGYWRQQQLSEQRQENFPDVFTGGEAHAYMIHHFLSQHQVILVPDFLIILLAAVLGKAVTLVLLGNRLPHRYQVTGALVGVTVAYGFLGLQTYIWFSVLIPWLLPSVMFWFYVLSVFWRYV